MMTTNKKSVVLVTSGFAPYRIPLWNALARKCNLTVILLVLKENQRLWEVDIDLVRCRVECLSGSQVYIKVLDWMLVIGFEGLTHVLDETNPDAVIIGGYESPGFWAARSWARRRGVPKVLWMESTLLSSRTTKYAAINWLKSIFVRSCEAYYATGKNAARYLEFFGARPERIAVGTNVPDISLFVSCERLGDRADGIVSLLYTGQLIERKGLRNALTALTGLKELRWKLCITGTGPLEAELREFTDRELPGRVAWHSHVQYNKMSSIYRSSDVLLFPSLKEVWGLAVNEALLSGLLVVGSDRAASVLELVSNGKNGYLVDPLSLTALRDGIEKAMRRVPADRHSIRESVAHLTPDSQADIVMKAISKAESSARVTATT
jgi:glycosyltransferase involved in cell wall biosynthesis